jgi:hypothetical protein
VSAPAYENVNSKEDDMGELPRGGGTFRNENVNRPKSIETPGEFEQKNLARISTDTAMKQPQNCAYPQLTPAPRPLSWKP